MKKIMIAAVAAMFMGVGANAQSDNNQATVADVVAELSQADALQFVPMYQQMLTDIENVCRTENLNDNKKSAKIEIIKDDYSYKFSSILVTAQNEIAISSIPMEYIENRVSK